MTDIRGVEATINIRSNGGRWIKIGGAFHASANCGSAAICQSGTYRSLKVGDKRWLFAVITKNYDTNCDANTCINNAANWGDWDNTASQTDPACGTPYECWNAVFRDESNCCSDSGIPSLVRGYYYEWGC